MLCPRSALYYPRFRVNIVTHGGSRANHKSLFWTTRPRSSSAKLLRNVQSNQNETKLIVASYNIRYAVGRYLISSGVLRKVGINPPRHRPDAVAQNIATAAAAFSNGVLLPPVDILALQEADKQTARAGGHHVARELADQAEHELGAHAGRNTARRAAKETSMVVGL